MYKSIFYGLRLQSFQSLLLVLPLLPGRSGVFGVESDLLMDFHSMLEANSCKV